MPRKSPLISCLLYPEEGYWEASKWRTPPLAERECGWPVDSARTSTLHGKAREYMHMREIKRTQRHGTIVPRYHGQQVLRPIDDKTADDKVKVDPRMPFWNPTQGRRDGLHDKRANSSSDLVDRQHERPTRNIRGIVRRGNVKRQMLAPGNVRHASSYASTSSSRFTTVTGLGGPSHIP